MKRKTDEWRKNTFYKKNRMNFHCSGSAHSIRCLEGDEIKHLCQLYFWELAEGSQLDLVNRFLIPTGCLNVSCDWYFFWTGERMEKFIRKKFKYQIVRYTQFPLINLSPFKSERKFANKKKLSRNHNSGFTFDADKPIK